MILLVENDPLLAEASYLLLDLQGYAVSVATNGREALTQLTWQKPDLIITDWHMPVMNGIELCNVLKLSSEWCAIPIILMSGLPQRPARNPPYDLFLQKPFQAAHLLDAVHRLVDPTQKSKPGHNSGQKQA
ncbi:MAG: response regulator [Pseudomonadota bacterium]